MGRHRDDLNDLWSRLRMLPRIKFRRIEPPAGQGLSHLPSENSDEADDSETSERIQVAAAVLLRGDDQEDEEETESEETEDG